MTCSRCSGVCTCSSAPVSVEAQPELLPGDDSAVWRREVSERLHRYRARRRPRGPRYPSLRLRFEAPEGNWNSAARESTAPPEPMGQAPIPPSVTSPAVAMAYVSTAPAVEAAPSEKPLEAPRSGGARRHESGKIIEFPAPAYIVEDFSHALAEPILDRPRILEAPEVVPPPPALGGITIEPTAQAEPERHAGIDMPLQSAPVGARVLAAALDGFIVSLAAGVFGGVFYRLTHVIPGLWPWAVVGAGLLVSFWFVYQYLFLVHCGSTPGLRVLRLQLERFDGKPAGRRTRRARVLCHVLSLAALGMGYAWQFLDEDGLCWHERVTKTHIAVQPQEPNAIA
jgi:uncharacterized RDD family membrane protein YckC